MDDELSGTLRRFQQSTPVGRVAHAGVAIGGAVLRGVAKGRTALGMDADQADSVRPDARPGPRRTSDIKLPPMRRKISGGRGR